MTGTHKEFVEELKVTSKKQTYQNWASSKKTLGEDHSIEAYYELQRWFKEGKKQYLEYKKQRIKNKYQNWVLKRKEDKKDYSMDLFKRLQKYLQREEQKLEEFMQEYCQNSGKKHTGPMVDNLKDDDIVYEAKNMLFEWRKNDIQYQKMKEEIEELRSISDKPLQSLTTETNR